MENRTQMSSLIDGTEPAPPSGQRVNVSDTLVSDQTPVELMTFSGSVRVLCENIFLTNYRKLQHADCHN